MIYVMMKHSLVLLRAKRKIRKLSTIQSIYTISIAKRIKFLYFLLFLYKRSCMLRPVISKCDSKKRLFFL